jgi:integrase
MAERFITLRNLNALIRARKPGRTRVAPNLFCRIAVGGTAAWVMRYRLDGRSRQMGFGSCTLITLNEAREMAHEARRLLAKGIDPLAERKAKKAQRKLDAAKAVTFQACAEAYIGAQRAGWRSAKHAGQWFATLGSYAYPVFGALPVQAVDTALVMKVLEPIWTTKPETASRLRGRIESVLDWAKVRGYREGPNPAIWRGHLSQLLPKLSKVHKVKHFAALAYKEVPDFMRELRGIEGFAARALEFTVLVAARTGEVRGARWCEINLADGVWTIPGSRMKSGREHRVPLSLRAIELLQALPRVERNDHVFAGEKRGESINDEIMLNLARRIRPHVTVHGFRSSFRTWIAEMTGYPSEVAEMALAHTVGNAVEQVYRRSDLFDKRRRLMSEWSIFCSASPREVGEVVSIRDEAS